MNPPERPDDETPGLPGTLSEHELLRIATESARVGLVMVSPERRYLYANATYAEILGLPSADLVGKRVRDVLSGVYEEQVGPRLDRAFAGEGVAFELRRPTPDGDRYFAVNYEPRVVDGAVSLVVVVLTDVTAQRQAGVDARRLAAMVESSDDAIIGMDLEGTVTSWNNGAERLFGYSARDMVGTPIMRLIPEDRRDEERYILERIRRNERVKHFETVRTTRSGEAITVSVTASPIRDDAGRVVGASKVARDITERERADEALRFQRAMLLTERELTLDGILVVDDRSNVLSYNARFAEMWGVHADILSTRADHVLLDAVKEKLADPEGFMARVRDLYDRHDEASHDEVDLADGRTFDRYSAPMRDPEGRYYGRVWYFRDVTERRRAEAALRAERDRAQRYLDTADVILLALDTEGRVTAINRKGCDLLGWSEAELIGRDWIETCLPERTRGTLREVFADLLAGDVSSFENPVLARDGEERRIEWRNRVLRDAAGSIVGTFSSGSDVTERHRAEEALRAAEERMRFALRNAGVGIWDLDYTTGVLRMSEILEAHYGMEPGTFPGTLEAFLQAVHPDDRSGLAAAIDEAKSSRAEFSSQHRARWPDGSVRWMNSVGRVHLDERGEPVRALGISIDVTERRSLEEQYHQAQKMEAIGRLAGGVAHDFNNLLTSILGHAQLLLFDCPGEDPRRDDLLEIQHAGRTAADLTEQLLAFSRQQIIEPRLLDLNAVISGMGGMLERLIGEDVEVVLNLRPGPMSVRADPGQMEQVILNLAVNARDAMPTGGILLLETESVELDEHYSDTHFSVTPGSYVALTVSDNGSGMTPEVRERLFEPFFTSKELGKGTGLGLATVHGIVERGGGRISVYTELGEGTAFTVYLPRADAQDVVPEATSLAAPPSAAGETVLVVEDASGVREVAKRMLERQGYVVLVASDPQEALHVLEGHPSVDVILTDVVMPGGSGPELMSRIGEDRPGLKVLYMSGYTEEAISHRGVLDPGVAFVQKPFTADVLGRKLREVLDG